MMRHPLARLVLLAVTAALLAVTMATSAAASESKTDASGQTEPGQPDGESGDWAQQSEPDHAGTRSARWPGRHCKFHARAGNPHPSGGDVSGHGTWVNSSNPMSRCPSHAQVTVKVQAHGCWYNAYPYPVCTWVTHGTKTRSVRSKQQVPVHYRCHTFERRKTLHHTQ